MKLVIGDREHDMRDALQEATLADLLALKAKTGIGMKTLKASLNAMGELADPEDFLDREDILVALNALVWLCRRHDGETLTMEQANSFPLSDLSFVPDEDEAEPDPTSARPGSEAGDDNEAWGSPGRTGLKKRGSKT